MTSARLPRLLQTAAARQDVVFATLFIFVVVMMVVPLPTVMVDTLIAANLALTLLVLISATYLKGVLDLSTFPSIILVTTVFRLALTVSTSRLILTTGDAGHIVRSFGEFVVGGNVLVGLVIFLVIAVVQFVVVTKGSERIAEVAARFTLDALPGKQMAVDGDFRAGDITKEEARRRRRQLESESQFFGSMDGAMKFVKGDAIASLVIVFVNLLGGLCVGLLQHGLSLSEAGRHYTLLTVGDGLVAQIPSMFIAVAAGTVVTRVSGDDAKHLGTDMMRQLSAEPKALALCAVALAGLAFVPGFPPVIFLALAIAVGGVAYALRKRPEARDENALAESAARADAPAPPSPSPSAREDEQEQEGESVVALPMAAAGDPFVVRASPADIVALCTTEMTAALAAVEASLKARYGFVPGSLGFAVDSNLPHDTLAFDVEGVEVTRKSAEHGASWAANPKALGNAILLLRRRHASETFGLQDAARWLDELHSRMETLVAEVKRVVPLRAFTRIVQHLLREDVPLVQARPLLEAIAASWDEQADVAKAFVAARFALRRQIVSDLRGSDAILRLMILSPHIEDAFRKSSEDLQDLGRLHDWREVIRTELSSSGAQAHALVTEARLRMRALIESERPSLAVLSYSEIPADCPTEIASVLGKGNANRTNLSLVS